MAEIIKIAELNIDDKKLLSSLSTLKASIKDLADENKHLQKSGAETSETFIKNEAELKTLRGEYGKQIKVLQTTATSQAKLTTAIDKEIKSISDASKNNKDLKAVRNELNASTEEGAKAIADINKKLDKNTDFIKENTSSLEQQKQGIGDYTSGIKKAKLGAQAFGLALKTAGIGLVIAGIAKLTEVFSENQKVMDFVNTAGRAFSIVFKDITNFFIDNTGKVVDFFKAIASDPLESVKKLGDSVKENLIERFESMLEVVGFLGSAVKKFFSGDFAGALADAKEAGTEFVDVLTGVDDALAKGTKFVEDATTAMLKYGAETILTADAQIQLAKSAEIALAINRGLKEEYERQAETLRQVRDDETKSFDERLKASNDLKVVLDKQSEAMIQNADLAIANARSQNTLNQTTESAVALIDAQNEKKAILNQITGQYTEQLISQNGVIKEIGETEAETLARTVELKEQFLLDDIARAEAEVLRLAEAHILEVETLALNEQEKADLVIAIGQKKDQDIFDLRKANNKKLTDAEAKFEANRIKQKEATLNAIIGLTDAESSIGKVALIAKQVLALKEQAIDLGLFTSKASLKASEATVDIASGTAKSASALPFPANIPLIAGFVASVAGIIGSIKSATSKGKSSVSGTKFATGGILTGASHANGGIQTRFGELEGGEAVINTKSTSAFKPLLSAINEAGGGRKFADGGVLGEANAPSGDLFNYELLAEAVASLPAPVVSVEEVSDVANRINAVETGSNF